MSFLNHFNYQLLGDPQAPKLVFLHGLMGSAANWRKITTAFTEKYHILLYDQRGHGRSFQPSSGYKPEDYASDLQQILKELGWEKIFLVGHSLGGRNALNFAFKNPKNLTCLVIEDIGPSPNEAAAQRIRYLLDLVPVPFSSRSVARDFFQEDFLQKIGGHPQAKILSQYFYTNLQERADGKIDWRFSKPGILASVEEGRAHSRWHEVEALKVPTLIIRGENSEELTPEDFRKMQKVNSLVTGVEIKGAGHWVHSDQPQEFCRVVAQFFEGVSSGRHSVPV